MYINKKYHFSQSYLQLVYYKLLEIYTNKVALTLQQTANAFKGFGTAFVLTTSFIKVSYNFLWNAVILSNNTYSSFCGNDT